MCIIASYSVVDSIIEHSLAFLIVSVIQQVLLATLVPILVKVEDQSTWTLYSALDQSTF